MIFNAIVKNPIVTEDSCKVWLEKLVEIIDMKILIPPVAKLCETEGNEGVTGAVVIETSHSTIHIWHKVPDPYVKMDVYSCKDFDPQKVIDHVNETMGIVSGGYMLVDRNGVLPESKQIGII
jgi:S-adenosylmethionine/arginine decarboxylase-like enzyme